MYKSNILFLLLFLVIFVMKPSPAGADWKPPTKFLAELYNETTNIKRQDGNWISMVQSLQGFRTRLGMRFSGDVYLKERAGGDANREYWNNRGEVMLGMRLNYSRIVYIGTFAEYVKGKYFGVENEENPFTRDIYYDDLRMGLLLWHGWNGKPLGKNMHFPFSLWDEVYGDAIFYRQYDHNIIYYLNTKLGTRILSFGKTALDLYLTNYLMLDRLGDFWNNRSDTGLGLRIKPWRDIELSLFVEYLDGQYINRESRYENTKSKYFDDIRVGIIFWYGWGF